MKPHMLATTLTCLSVISSFTTLALGADFQSPLLRRQTLSSVSAAGRLLEDNARLERQVNELRQNNNNLVDINGELLQEVKQLRRKNYLLELRKDACPIGDLLGNGRIGFSLRFAWIDLGFVGGCFWMFSICCLYFLYFLNFRKKSIKFP